MPVFERKFVLMIYYINYYIIIACTNNFLNDAVDFHQRVQFLNQTSIVTRREYLVAKATSWFAVKASSDTTKSQL